MNDDTGDDQEAERRGSTATVVIGSWLRDIADQLAAEIADVDSALTSLGISLDKDAEQIQTPRSDARFETLVNLIKDQLFDGQEWKSTERIVVFTEYKTTLDYLLARLRKTLPDCDDRITSLFGGMDDTAREQVKEQFNDPASSVRILLATDAASEGLNLQNTARYLLHYDCPWNPSRIEQRNGRLDRHGQARHVQTFHFASDEDSDLRFMSHLIKKVDQVREDLGAVGELLDEALHRRLIEGEDTEQLESMIDRQLENMKGTVDLQADNTAGTEDGTAGYERLQALAAEVDLTPTTQRQVLDVAMGMHAGRPQISDPDEADCSKVLNPGLHGWHDIIDESVRRTATGGRNGPMPLLTFSIDPFMHDVGGRTVFRPNHNIQMVHLGHPLMGKALNLLGQKRYPGTQAAVSRWTTRLAPVSDGQEALILLHVEEIAVNELRETFHHWVRTISLPVASGDLGDPLPHVPANQLPQGTKVSSSAQLARAAEILGDVEPDLQAFIKRYPRIMSLFRLIYEGSSHESLTVRD